MIGTLSLKCKIVLSGKFIVMLNFKVITKRNEATYIPGSHYDICCRKFKYCQKHEPYINKLDTAEIVLLNTDDGSVCDHLERKFERIHFLSMC